MEQELEQLTTRSREAIRQLLNAIIPTPLNRQTISEAEAVLKDLDRHAEAIQETQLFPLEADVLQEFVEDSGQHLIDAGDALQGLQTPSEETSPAQYIEAAFRHFHTLKGNAGAVGLTLIENIAHMVESILEPMKADHQNIQGPHVKILLHTVETLLQSVASLSGNDEMQLHDIQGIQKRLEQLIALSSTTSGQTHDAKSLGDLLVEMGVTTPEAVQLALEQQHIPVGQLLVSMGEVEQEDVEKALAQQRAAGKNTPLVSSSESDVSVLVSSRQEIRLPLNKVNHLVDQTEILERTVQSLIKGDSLNAILELEQQVQLLQKSANSLRCVELEPTFRKMSRVAYNVAQRLNKQVEVTLQGETLEIEKTLVDQLNDPLLHLIRNAVDHGIESPEIRATADKPEVGQIRLIARQNQGQLHISLEDDGHGLDREKILQHAQHRGIVSSQQKLTDNEVWQLIFAPGFSTAQEVSSVSGRGIGMDVVKSSIEALQGRIEIQTTPQQGTQFVLRFPLS